MTKQEQAIRLVQQLNDKNLAQVIGIMTDLVNGRRPYIEAEPFSHSLTTEEFMERVNELRNRLPNHHYGDINAEMQAALAEKYGTIM